MLIRIPGKAEPVFGRLDRIVVASRKGGAARALPALFIGGQPWGVSETTGLTLVRAKPEERASLFAAGYFIPYEEEVAALRRVLGQIGGRSARGVTKRRSPAHYALMVERRRTLGMINASNQQRKERGKKP